MKRLASLVFLMAFVAACSSFAAADTLDGHTFTTVHQFPGHNNDAAPDTFTAPGVDPYAGGIANLTVSGNDVIAETACGAGCFWTGGNGFNGWEVDSNDAGFHFDSVSLASNSVAGFDMSRVSWDGTHIFIDLQGLDANGSVDLNVDIVADTPEPASLVLLGSGLLGLAGSIRRKLA